MGKNINYLLLLFSLLFLYSCDNQEFKFDYSSKPLNELLQNVPIQKIDLNTISPSTLVPKTKSHEIGKNKKDKSQQILGVIENAIALKNKTYILDRSQNAIVVADSNGYINSKITRPGKGPGEFGQISKIFKNDDYIFIYDRGNSKIHVFDHNWKLAGNKMLKNGLMKSIYEASNKYLFIPEETTSQNLVNVLDLNLPFKKHGSLMPRLIPFGKQPFAYNNVRISGNDNIIIASYVGLPFIFIFDNELQHLKTLYFTSNKIKSIQSPPLVPVAENPGSGVSVPTIFMGFRLLENNDFILSLGKEIYYLEASKELKYELISAKYLHYRESKKQKEDGYGINAKYIELENNYILVSSINEESVYRFNINDIKKKN